MFILDSTMFAVYQNYCLCMVWSSSHNHHIKIGSRTKISEMKCYTSGSSLARSIVTIGKLPCNLSCGAT